MVCIFLSKKRPSLYLACKLVLVNYSILSTYSRTNAEILLQLRCCQYMNRRWHLSHKIIKNDLNTHFKYLISSWTTRKQIYLPIFSHRPKLFLQVQTHWLKFKVLCLAWTILIMYDTWLPVWLLELQKSLCGSI